ncbi:MAG: serine hydrolase, partial [Bacteroidota bacterium]
MMSYPKVYTLLLCFCSFLGYGQNDKLLNSTDQEWIAKITQEYIEVNDIPSVVLAIVHKDQVDFQTYGVEDRTTNVKVSPQTNYQIGSLSKMFTGVIMHRLIQEGKLNPEASITEYLKDHVDQNTLAQFTRVKVRDLLHHRAGFPNHGPSTPPTPNGIAMLGGYPQALMLSDLAKIDLKDDFDAQMSYSNYAFGLLGFIAEQVSGKTYADLLQEYILQAYQLGSTTSDIKQTQNLATPYFIGKRTKPTQAWEMGAQTPAGGLFSNADDLCKMMQTHLAVYQNKDTSSPLFLTQDIRPFDRGGFMDYGYGFMATRSTFDSTAHKFEHGGDLDGFASQYKFFPALGLGYILLTSSGGTWFNELDALIEQRILGIPPAKVVNLPGKTLKSFVGKYRFPSGFELEIVKVGNRLKVLFPGSDPFNIYPESETRLFFRHMNVQMEFTKDTKGRVEKVAYIQNG